MIRRGLILGFLTVLAACEGPTAPGERDQLDAARALWNAKGGDSYSFELTYSCFCVLGGRRMDVTVRDGTVFEAQYRDSGGPVESALLLYVPTVPDLFDLIGDALDRKTASFLASYDGIYGFPARIEIDNSASAVDDEVAITARNLVLLRSFAEGSR